MVTFNRSIEVFNRIVWFGEIGYWIWTGIYKSRNMHSSKRIVDCNAKPIEFVVSNLHPAITNRIIIMDLVLEVINKDPDKILVPYGKRLQWLGRYLLMKVWDIYVSDVYKVLNIFTVIANWSLLYLIFTLQFRYIGKGVSQSGYGLFSCKRNIVGNINNLIKGGKFEQHRKFLTQSVGLRYWALNIKKSPALSARLGYRLNENLDEKLILNLSW